MHCLVECKNYEATPILALVVDYQVECSTSGEPLCACEDSFFMFCFEIEAIPLLPGDLFQKIDSHLPEKLSY